MFNLFKHELTSRWMTILGWGIGLTLFSALYIVIYPEVADQMAGLADVSLYQAMGVDLASFAGFIASVVVQIMPLILGVYVIMLATGTLAGEEENGTLELVVAMPLKRWQILIMKTLALLIAIFLILLILAAGCALIMEVVLGGSDIAVDVEPMQLFAAVMATYPMLVLLFCMSLFFGAFMPSRRSAMMVMFIFYLASYIANSAAGLVESLDWLASLSIFDYIDTSATVFTEGPDAGNMAILLGISVIFLGLALWAFQGRNITVGQWMWQRSQSPA